MPKKHQRIGFPTKRQTMSWSELHVKTHWHHLDESLSRNRKQNKPRCYPQQQLGNNASKENLRARLFPILPRNPWIGTCPGTSRNLPPGIRPGTAPEPILAKTPWLKLLGKNLEKSPKKLGTSPKSGKNKWVLKKNTKKKKRLSETKCPASFFDSVPSTKKTSFVRAILSGPVIPSKISFIPRLWSILEGAFPINVSVVLTLHDGDDTRSWKSYQV